MLPSVSGADSIMPPQPPPILPSLSGSVGPSALGQIYIDPSAPIAGPTSPFSGPVDEVEPEEIIINTFKLLQALNSKIDAMIGQQNRIAFSVIGIDRKVGDNTSSVREVGNGISDLTGNMSKVQTIEQKVGDIDTKLTSIPGYSGENNSEANENEATENENEAAENEATENENEAEENYNAQGGYRRRTRKVGGKKQRKTNKRKQRK